jgi:hypothetical protein
MSESVSVEGDTSLGDKGDDNSREEKVNTGMWIVFTFFTMWQ